MLKFPLMAKKPAPIKRLAFGFRFLDFARNDKINSLEATGPYAFGFCLISAWAAARQA